jgi:putative hydrolase of the HAD superfamily
VSEQPDRQPRAVLFDLDDTIFDHARATRVALASLRDAEPAFGAWSLDELERRHRVVLEVWHQEVLAGRATIDQARVARFGELIVAAGGPDARDRASTLAAAYRSVYATAWFTVPGAVALIEAIRERGIAVAIVTNNVLVEQQLKLERCGLTSLRATLVTSEEVGQQKPDVRIFQAALDRLGVRSSESVMVGDAWATDIEGAMRSGIRPVWLNRFGEISRDTSVAELRALEPIGHALAVVLGSSTSRDGGRGQN